MTRRLSPTRQGTILGGACRRWDAPQHVVVPAAFVSTLALNRGADLLRSETSDSLLVRYLDLLGQDTWGVLVCLAGAAVLAGLLAHRVGTVILGFAIAWAVMSGYAIVMVQGLTMTSPDLTGARFAGPAVGYAGLYGYWTVVVVRGMRRQLSHRRRAGDPPLTPAPPEPPA